MKELQIITSAIPEPLAFDNFEEVKKYLNTYVKQRYELIDYNIEGYKVAEADKKELEKLKKVIATKKKEIKAPYASVEKMLEELEDIIKVPLKVAKDYMAEIDKENKRKKIMAYAEEKAQVLGIMADKVLASPAFFDNKWLNKTTSEKTIYDTIDSIINQAAKEINSIQQGGGDSAAAITARYVETLTMDGMDAFTNALHEVQDGVDTLAVESEDNVLGYKVLKITATEDQMASIMDQLMIMGVDVEEIEDGMPTTMEELNAPDFESFVAFDIETTGSYGAGNGDDEAKITEIGAVRVVNGEIVEKFDMLANPGRKIVPRVARLTHITNEMIADKPPIDDVIRMFHEFVGDSIVVGHNIKSSDLRYITKAAKMAGINFDVPFLDTYLLAKKFKEAQGWDKVSLGYLAEYYGLEHEEAHRAWSDAEVNAKVYFELKGLWR